MFTNTTVVLKHEDSDIPETVYIPFLPLVLTFTYRPQFIYTIIMYNHVIFEVISQRNREASFVSKSIVQKNKALNEEHSTFPTHV